MNRRWRAGMSGTAQGVDWRVVPGIKPNGDLALEIRTPGWVRVSMALGCLEADFYFENEDALYPPPYNLGGRFYMKRLQLAVDEGWEVAAAMTRRERALKEGWPIRSPLPERHIAPVPACPSCRNTERFWKRIGGTAWMCEVCCPIERYAPIEVEA